MAVFDNIKGIGVASGFKLQAESALDPRLTVATVAERDELVTGNGAYEGMSVYVKANKKTYQLQGKTNADWVDVTSEAASTSALESEIKTARGTANALGDRLDTIDRQVNNKVDVFTLNNGLQFEEDGGAKKLALVLDPAEDNALTNSSIGLKVVVPEGKDYTVTVDTTKTTDGAAKSYTLKQLGKDIAIIDIPKDMVVSGGVVETYTDETAPVDPSKTDGSKLAAGTYIVLTIANKAKDKLYIPADGLVEYVTSGSKTGDPIIVTVDPTTHKVTATLSDKGIATAKIKDGAVTEVKLAKAVTDKLAKTNLVVDGTTTTKGIVKLSSTIADDETMAATPKAVNTVKGIANTAASNATTAKSDAATAKSTATEAKNTADTASETATVASTTANEAKELATTADGNATTAKSTAEAAKTTATNAKTTADAAKKTAEAAKTTADGKVSVVWVAKGETIPTTATANSLCFRIL